MGSQREYLGDSLGSTFLESPREYPLGSAREYPWETAREYPLEAQANGELFEDPNGIPLEYWKLSDELSLIFENDLGKCIEYW